MRGFGLFSGGNAEQRVHEGGVGDDVAPTNPFYLPFSHHRQSLITNQGAPRGPEPLEAEAGPHQPFYSPVILLHDVVQVLDLAQLGETPEPLGLLHVGHRLGIGGVPVDREGARVDRVRPGQRLAKKALGGCGVAPCAEPEVDGLAAAVGTGTSTGL